MYSDVQCLVRMLETADNLWWGVILMIPRRFHHIQQSSPFLTSHTNPAPFSCATAKEVSCFLVNIHEHYAVVCRVQSCSYGVHHHPKSTLFILRWMLHSTMHISLFLSLCPPPLKEKPYLFYREHCTVMCKIYFFCLHVLHQQKSTLFILQRQLHSLWKVCSISCVSSTTSDVPSSMYDRYEEHAA